MTEHMTNEQVLALLEHRLTGVEETHADLRDAIKELTVAINKLAIIDERQVQATLVIERLAQTIDKAHTRIDGITSEFAKALERAKVDCATATTRLEERVKSLEDAAPVSKQTNQWVLGAVYGAAALAVLFVAKKVGLN